MSKLLRPSVPGGGCVLRRSVPRRSVPSVTGGGGVLEDDRCWGLGFPRVVRVLWV